MKKNMQQPKLKIGDKVKVMYTGKLSGATGNIIELDDKLIGVSLKGYIGIFYFKESELQLITPKQKSKWKYSRKELVKMIKTKCFFGYNESKAVRWLLATQPQPIKEDNYTKSCTLKQQSKEIEFEEIKKIKNQDSNGYLTDVHNQIITIKINEIIDTLNSLTKRNIK